MVLLIYIGSVALVAFITLKSFRFIVRRSGNKELIEEGLKLTEAGIEFPRFIFMGTTKVNYSQIKSVELVPFPKSLALRLRYGPSVSSRVGAGSPFKETVVVQLKPPRFIQCHLFNPSNPSAIYE